MEPPTKVLNLADFKRRKRLPQDPLRQIESLANLLEASGQHEDPEMLEVIRLLRDKPQAVLEWVRRQQKDSENQ